MKIQAMKIKYMDGFQCRQFKIRLDNNHMYLFSMNVDKYANERIYYTYALYDGNKTLFSGSDFNTPNKWETCGLHAMHCLLLFLIDQPEKWTYTADCNDIECYLYDHK